MLDATTPNFMTVEEAARFLKMPKGQLYDAISEGTIAPPIVARLGRRLRINQARLIEWLDKGGGRVPAGRPQPAPQSTRAPRVRVRHTAVG